MREIQTRQMRQMQMRVQGLQASVVATRASATQAVAPWQRK
jgi:hypothetical protein